MPHAPLTPPALAPRPGVDAGDAKKLSMAEELALLRLLLLLPLPLPLEALVEA